MLFKHTNKLSLFEEYLREKRRLAESTIYVYIKAIEQFLVTNPNLKELEDYNNFLVDHTIKKSSSQVYSIFRIFIEFNTDDAILRNRLIDGLIRAPPPARMKKERKYISTDQTVDLINNFQYEKHKVIALIQANTGVRAGDVLKIRRGDIIPETYKGENVLRIIVIGKGSKRNVIYIHDKLVQILIINYIIQNFTDEIYYFIENSSNNRHARVTFNSTFRNNYNKYLRDLKQSMETIGMEQDSFATHDFRRCFARDVWEKWKDLVVLQNLMNHADPKTTMRYLKTSGLKNIDYHKEMQS